MYVYIVQIDMWHIMPLHISIYSGVCMHVHGWG